MRAAALLQRLPHTAAAGRPRRPRRRRHGKRTTATRAADLSLAQSAARRDVSAVSAKSAGSSTAGSLIVQRARLAGGPVDHASYTCACGFVFAASVSTTVACPHCGAAQAW
jgi:hypothetical protein